MERPSEPAAEALAVQLAAEGRALRALARRLVVAADAEDLVQEASAAALARPDLRRPGAWLSGTVRQLAALLRRTRRRRAARELAVARPELDAAADPAAIAAHAELLRRVATAVEQLDEPFRTVIVLRFWRGLLPEAIAAQLGVPRNTVRSRLQRGIERLRARLDREHGNRERWSAPLATVAGVRAVDAAAAGAVTWWIAGNWMKTKLLLGAAAVLGLAVALSWPASPEAATQTARAPGGLAAATAAPPAAPAVPPAAGGERTALAVADAPTPAAAATPRPDDAVTWSLRVRVVDEREAPVADAAVTVWAARPVSQHGWWGHDVQPFVELRADRDGRATATVGCECVVAAAVVGASESAEVMLFRDRDGHDEHRLVVEPTVALRGVVLRAGDAPVADARVCAIATGVSALQRGVPPTPAPCVTDVDGRFALRVHRHEHYEVHAKLGDARSLEELCRMEDSPLEVVLRFPDAIGIDGAVVDPDGKPVAQAQVAVWRVLGPDEAPGRGETADAKTDAAGRFCVPVRRYARYRLLAAADGHATSDLVAVETSAEHPHAEVRLALLPFATIAGRIVHQDGSPLAGVRIGAWPEDGAPTTVFTAPMGREPTQVDRFPRVAWVTSGADGSFALRVHPRTTWTLQARPFADNWRLELRQRGVRPGNEAVEFVVRDDELAGCVVRGSVVRSDGLAPGDFVVEVVDCDDAGRIVSSSEVKAVIDGDRFRLPLLPLGRPFFVCASLRSDPGTRAALAPAWSAKFVARPEGVDLRLCLQAWGEVVVRVLAGDGRPAPWAGVSLIFDDGGALAQQRVDGEGRARFAACVPGARQLRVLRDGTTLDTREITVVPGPNPEIVLRVPANGR